MEVKTLVCSIVRAKKAYYESGKAIMSDFDYDALEDKLKQLDPQHPILYAVGYDDSYDWWLKHYEQ